VSCGDLEVSVWAPMSPDGRVQLDDPGEFLPEPPEALESATSSSPQTVTTLLYRGIGPTQDQSSPRNSVLGNRRPPANAPTLRIPTH